MSIEIEPKTQLITLTIDGQTISIPKGTTVYQAAKQLGLDIPIFCYQDRMPPFGACRVCLVEVEKMAKPQASCTLEATDGMVVKTQSALAVEARKSILEFLLINHPLDCPICDRGGECPLQENALAHGPGESRFFETKRHFKKPLPLGPVLMLDRERCIICARCTRFGDLIAGDHALEFVERGFKTEVGTPNNGPAESKFIGNTIMICPVGALTSQVYRFRARPWDNDSTNTTCTLCPVGCSMIVDSRDGEIMRTRSKENAQVNDIWLCDKGWFGYEFSSSQERLERPMIRRNGQLVHVTWEEALLLVASKMAPAKESGKIAGFGGNTLTVEENYLFQKLIREVAGSNHVDYRIGMPILSLDEEGLAPGMEMSIGECESLNTIWLFGLDLTEEFPVIWLRLRQAINKGAKVIFAGSYKPEIAPYLSKIHLHPAGGELKTLEDALHDVDAETKGAIFVGSQYLASTNRKPLLATLLEFKTKHLNISLNLMEGHGNSYGARFAGMHPELSPMGKTQSNPGMNAIEVLKAAAKDGWDFLHVAGANPALKFPAKLWKEARAKIGFLLVQDVFLTETALEADVVLPALTYVEKGGHFINIEGRIQPLLPGKEVPENIKSDGEIFQLIAQKWQHPIAIDSAFLSSLAQEKIPLSRPAEISSSKNSSPTIDSGLTAIFAKSLFDQGVRMNHDMHLKQLVKEPFARLHPDEGKRLNLQTGELVSILSGEGSLKAKIQLDSNVALSTLVLPLGFLNIPVHDLGINLLNGLRVRIEKDKT